MQPDLILGTDGDCMIYKKYTESELREYLLSHAEIRAFYVSCIGGVGSGLINYFDSQGKNWCIIEDDDVLNEDAIVFLKGQGVPFFDDINELQDFEREWAR